MRKLRYSLARFSTLPMSDAALLDEDDAGDLNEALAMSVLDSISTDIEVTVGGVTMFLAAWRDPEHWSQDWAEKLGVDMDDAAERVDALLAEAVEEMEVLGADT
jgi:hypothetical protein